MNRTSIEYVINPDGSRGFNWAIMTGCLHLCRDVYCYNTMKSTSPLNRFYKKNRDKENGKLHIVTPDAGIYPYGFDPTYYPYKLEEPIARKKPATIFVANAADIFGAWVPDYIIECILNVIRQCPQHRFILLTKNYKRLYEFGFPDNTWVGITQEEGIYADYNFTTTVDGEIKQKIPLFSIGCLCNLTGIKAKNRFISFEPLLKGQDEGVIPFEGVNWIIIGSETGPRAEQHIPKREWVTTLVKSARDRGIKVWMKDNLVPVFQKTELIQELPGV